MKAELFPWAQAMLEVLRTVDPTASASDLVTDGLHLDDSEAMQTVSAFAMSGFEVIAHGDSSGFYIPAGLNKPFGLAVDFEDGQIIARFYEEQP